MCSPDYADAVEREGFWERERPEWEDRKQQIIDRTQFGPDDVEERRQAPSQLQQEDRR